MDERIKVKYPNGFEAAYLPKIAEILLKRKGMTKVGEGKAAPKPEGKVKKIDRDALVKQAIKDGLGTKEELLKLSDSEIASLVGEE